MLNIDILLIKEKHLVLGYITGPNFFELDIPIIRNK